jgi:hypothetical protein
VKMSVHERRGRARRWLDLIRSDVRELLIDNYIFWELQEVWKNRPLERLSGIFPRFVVNGFINSMVVGIRKQAKGGDHEVSMCRFIRELEKFPELASREHYLSFFADAEEWLRQHNGEEFYDSIAGAGASTLPQQSSPHISMNLSRRLHESSTTPTSE